MQYGEGYFDTEEGGCACGECKPPQPKPELGPSRIRDEEIARKRKSVKNEGLKERQRQKAKLLKKGLLN